MFRYLHEWMLASGSAVAMCGLVVAICSTYGCHTRVQSDDLTVGITKTAVSDDMLRRTIAAAQSAMKLMQPILDDEFEQRMRDSKGRAGLSAYRYATRVWFDPVSQTAIAREHENVVRELKAAGLSCEEFFATLQVVELVLLRHKEKLSNESVKAEIRTAQEEAKAIEAALITGSVSSATAQWQLLPVEEFESRQKEMALKLPRHLFERASRFKSEAEKVLTGRCIWDWASKK